MRVRMTRAFAVVSDEVYPFVVQMTQAEMECIRELNAVMLAHPYGAVAIPVAVFLRLCQEGCLEQVQDAGI